MNLDAIGNKTTVDEVVNVRESREGYLYKQNGHLFLFISGGFTEAEMALSVHMWGCEGFVSTKLTEVTAYNGEGYRVEMPTNPPKIVAREPMPVKLDGNVLSGVPAGGIVTIEDFPYPTDGTDITLQFGRPGTYVVKCEGFPYTPVEVEVVYGN